MGDDGAVLLARDYDPYGQMVAADGTGSSGYGFTGEQYDRYIKNPFLRARWYSPVVGRFTSLDPWRGDTRQPQTLHKYLYALNDPIVRQDPSGKQPYFDPGYGCWIPPVQPDEALTPREYVEQYKRLHGSYDEIYSQLSLEEDFKSSKLHPRLCWR